MDLRELKEKVLEDTPATEDADTSINENLLTAISLDLLYDGMIVQDDIYDSTRERKLINNGSTLDEYQIERIRRLNSGSGTIYVTGRTKKAMETKRPNNVDIEVRREVEDSTGYTETKNVTQKYLEEIAVEKKVDMESLEVVAHELKKQLEEIPQDVVVFLINAMAPVDEYLQRHSVNVSMLNGLIARWMGMASADVDRLVLIGLLHDTGKIMIPPKVLNAPRKLTLLEYEIIKKHVDHTYELLNDFSDDIRMAACSHHERLDGLGYNNKLRGSEILLEARITSISDTYDAIVAQRAYQGAQSPFKALSILDKLSNTQLDGDIIRLFIENITKDLIGKPVMMSDGTIGIIREPDYDDIEYPRVELSGRILKTDENLYCTSMYNDE